MLYFFGSTTPPLEIIQVATVHDQIIQGLNNNYVFEPSSESSLIISILENSVTTTE